MKIELPFAIAQLNERIKSEQFVRAVLSGQRRSMQTEYERVDIKPVLIKDEIKLQVVSSNGKQDITKNVELDFDFTPFLVVALPIYKQIPLLSHTRFRYLKKMRRLFQ